MAMIVSCRMSQCCYHDVNGFCAKPIAVHIDQMGMCNVLWKRGQRKLFPPKERLERDKLIIEDAGNVQLIKETKKDDLLQKIQEKISLTKENEEKGEASSEDRRNGATA